MAAKDGILSSDDAMKIGLKIVEMADRVRVITAVVPKAEAAWVFEMDGVSYRVTVKKDG